MENILSDIYMEEGTSKYTAAYTFHEFEKATKAVTFDISLMSFISCIGKSGKEHYNALYLIGEEEWRKNGTQATFSAPLVSLQIPSGTPFNREYPLLVMDGINMPSVSIMDDGIYLTSATAMQSLKKLLKIESIENGWIGACCMASRCAAIEKSKEVSFLYREQDGVKKVFAIFARKQANDYLHYDDLLRAVRNTGLSVQVSSWSISQRKRSVTFSGKSGEFTVTWSDTGMAGLSITRNGKTVPTSCETLERDIKATCKETAAEAAVSAA